MLNNFDVRRASFAKARARTTLHLGYTQWSVIADTRKASSITIGPCMSRRMRSVDFSKLDFQRQEGFEPLAARPRADRGHRRSFGRFFALSDVAGNSGLVHGERGKAPVKTDGRSCGRAR